MCLVVCKFTNSPPTISHQQSSFKKPFPNPSCILPQKTFSPHHNPLLHPTTVPSRQLAWMERKNMFLVLPQPQTPPACWRSSHLQKCHFRVDIFTSFIRTQEVTPVFSPAWLLLLYIVSEITKCRYRRENLENGVTCPGCWNTNSGPGTLIFSTSK